MQTLSTRVTDGTFEGPDGHKLYERTWHPDGGAARGVLVVVHGYAEHIQRYDYTAEQLARAGYLVCGFDLRGHGRSEGDRAFVRSADEFQRDLDAFLTRVRTLHAGLPIFILGHSMGGGIVALYAVERRPEVLGTLLSGAALYVPGPRRQGNVVLRIMRLLGRAFPRLPLVKLKAERVSRDPEVVARYVADPLIFHGYVRAGTAAAMAQAGRRIDAQAATFSGPLLVMHGSEDKLASVDGSKRFYEAAGSRDKTLRLYEGLYHEILNEPERDVVITEILAWMDSRLAAGMAGVS